MSLLQNIHANLTDTWATSVAYKQYAMVIKDGYPLICLVAHTSGTYATDVQSGYWQMVGSWKNNLINGNFDIWQRGVGPTTTISTTLYVADRWGANQFQTASCSRQSFVASGSHPGNSQFVHRCAGDGVTAMRMMIAQGVELINTIPLRSKTITLSFWIRFSAATTTAALGPFSGGIGYSNTSNDGPTFSTDYSASGSTNVILSQGSLPTVWTKYTATIAVSATAQNIKAQFSFSNLATPTSSDWYEISQVMLNEGPAPAAFQTAGANIQDEVAMCQRYYEKNDDLNIPSGSGGSVVQYHTGILNISGGGAHGPVFYKVQKRAPASTINYWNGVTPNQAFWRRPSVDGTNTVVFISSNSYGFVPVNVTIGTGYTISQLGFAWAADAEL